MALRPPAVRRQATNPLQPQQARRHSGRCGRGPRCGASPSVPLPPCLAARPACADGLVGVAVEPARPEVTVLGGRGLLVDPGLVRLRPGADARSVVVPSSGTCSAGRSSASTAGTLLDAAELGDGSGMLGLGAAACSPSNRLLSRGRALGAITQVREGDAPPRHRAGFRKAVELHARAGAACQKACQKPTGSQDP